MDTKTEERGIKCTEDPNKNPQILETSEIWNDAGFTPPDVCVYLVELLHCIYYGDVSPDCTLVKKMVELYTMKCRPAPLLFNIHDLGKMRDFARQNYIPTENLRDDIVAISITAMIIADYFRKENSGLCTGKD